MSNQSETPLLFCSSLSISSTPFLIIEFSLKGKDLPFQVVALVSPSTSRIISLRGSLILKELRTDLSLDSSRYFILVETFVTTSNLIKLIVRYLWLSRFSYIGEPNWNSVPTFCLRNRQVRLGKARPSCNCVPIRSLAGDARGIPPSHYLVSGQFRGTICRTVKAKFCHCKPY